jgi:hypothetical protein
MCRKSPFRCFLVVIYANSTAESFLLFTSASKISACSTEPYSIPGTIMIMIRRRLSVPIRGRCRASTSWYKWVYTAYAAARPWSSGDQDDGNSHQRPHCALRMWHSLWRRVSIGLRFAAASMSSIEALVRRLRIRRHYRLSLVSLFKMRISIRDFNYPCNWYSVSVTAGSVTMARSSWDGYSKWPGH